jgi:P63C domain
MLNTTKKGIKMNNEPIGRAKGGAARAANLSPERRKEIAQKAADAKKAKAAMPKITHEGVLKVLNIELSCYVLSNGQRVLSQRGISEAFTGNRGGGLVSTNENGAHKIPRFLAKKDVKSFINNDLMARINAPIEFMPKAGRSAFGYDSALLPEICEVILDASRANKNTETTEYKTAELLIRGFARVGIVALIDEATGYQKDREKDALAKILEAFVAKELQPYLKAFPSEYYEHLFRLYGYDYPPKDKRPQWRPAFFGIITNEVVYKRLAPGILPELKKLASKSEKKVKLMQGLTLEVGHPKLKEHLISIVSLLKISTTPQQFRAFVNQVHPRFGDTPELPFTASDSDV